MSTTTWTRAFVAAAAAVVAANGLADSELCLGECVGTGSAKTCTFKFELDVFAGETGYFRVQGCEGVQPTLGMEQGVEYIFDQTHPSNWFHPLGFAYGPDGVYAQNEEFEKAVAPPGGSRCNASTPCQHPQYLLNGVPLCDNDPCDEEDFGLDQYEGVYFSGGRDDWIGAGNFTVSLTITDDATTEAFYFCHIHNWMSGRIKVLDASGKQKNPEDLVPIPYKYDVVDEFDQACGTYNVSQFEGGKGCPDMTFLCNDNLGQFGKCMVALDCHMHVTMRVTGSLDPTVTFMHQMIAHHQNAVNMAKALLKESPPSLKCGTSYDGRRLEDADEDDPLHDFCRDIANDGGTPAVTLLWDIINTQNAQITFMRSWLRDNEQPEFDYCEHEQPFPAAVVGLAVGAVVLVCLAVVGTVCFMRRDQARGPSTVDTGKASTKELTEA